MTVRPVRRGSLVEEAVAELRRLVGSGQWPVGAELPGEPDAVETTRANPDRTLDALCTAGAEAQ